MGSNASSLTFEIVTTSKPRKRRQDNLAAIVSMIQIGSKSVDASLNEWLISRSMRLPIDEKWPESLKKEREERSVLSYKNGHGEPGRIHNGLQSIEEFIHRCSKFIWDDETMYQK